MVGACPAGAWKDVSMQTHMRLPPGNKASSGKHRQDHRPLHPSSDQYPMAVQAGRGREGGYVVPTQTPACPPHHCADPCSVSLLLAADRPVMGIYFPQLRALVPSLSSSAWCSQVNERLHNEVIACTGTSAGLAGAEAAPSPAKPSHTGSSPGPLQVTTHPACPRRLLPPWTFSLIWSQML